MPACVPWSQHPPQQGLRSTEAVAGSSHMHDLAQGIPQGHSPHPATEHTQEVGILFSCKLLCPEAPSSIEA